MSTPIPGALIQVSEVVLDPDFAQELTLLRSTISWLNGVVQTATKPVLIYGAVGSAKPRDLKMIPEGDQVHGALVFWSAQPIYATHATGGNGGLSDIIVWQGKQWRVLEVSQYQDYGYYRAVAVRTKAD